MRIRPLPQYLSFPLILWIAVLPGCGTKDDSTGIADNLPDVPDIEFDMLAGVLWGELAGVGGAMMLPSGGPGCLSISATDDLDGDGVPEEADFTFSSSGCHFTFDNGWGTTAGSIHVTDPGVSFGFASTLNGIAYTLSVEAQDDDPAETRVRTLNGTRTVAGSPSQMTLTQNVDVAYTVTNKPSATATETWQAVFTPGQGASVVIGYGKRVPDGGLVVTGPFTWVQNGATVVLSLETTVPLSFPPSCESPFPSAGEVHARVVSGGPAGYVRLAWSGCGMEVQIDFIEG